jgi:cell division protein FtsW
LGGASRWLNLGVFTFQPSELLKLTFILYLAVWLARPSFAKQNLGGSNTKNRISQTFIPFLIVLGVIAILLILQPDISTLGVIGLSALALYFIAATPVWQTFLIVLAGIGGLIALIKYEPYRFNRLLVFLKPETDPMGIGYQIKQALIAVGSGGVMGVGLGMSHQKFGFLPQSIGDSIFAIFAEETGFVGALILISLFLIFAWRGFKIAKDSKDKFHQLLVTGITFWITLQAFINIGSMVGILPLTGIPLPFISYGGTALVNELIAMGILLNISKQTS